MLISVVIATYNKPDYLKRALASYRYQEDAGDFEIVVADDGSDQSTQRVVSELTAPFGVHHVWHTDAGFRKTRILNRAIERSRGDYLIFTDDDCIVRRDFVASHRRLAGRGHFLSGGVQYVSEEASQRIDVRAIESQDVFRLEWLRSQGEKLDWRTMLRSGPWLGGLFDWASTTRPTFNGHNSSAWKDDIIAVNGFDERLGYGGLDREFGERLVNHGVRGKRVRHRAICLHLEHSRPYRDEKVIARNLAIRRLVRSTGRSWTDFGLVCGPSGRDR